MSFPELDITNMKSQYFKFTIDFSGLCTYIRRRWWEILHGF